MILQTTIDPFWSPPDSHHEHPLLHELDLRDELLLLHLQEHYGARIKIRIKLRVMMIKLRFRIISLV